MENYRVEFVGMAGVGKSYIAKRVFFNLKEYGYRVSDVNDKSYRYNFYSFKSFMNSLIIIKNTMPRFHLDSLKAMITLYLNFCKLNYVNENSEIQISDQGVFQSIGTLRKYNKKLKYDYFMRGRRPLKGNLPNLVVVIQADPEIIAKRRFNRDGVYELEDILQGRDREKLLIEELEYLSKINDKFTYTIINYEDWNSLNNIVDSIVIEITKNKEVK